MRTLLMTIIFFALHLNVGIAKNCADFFAAHPHPKIGIICAVPGEAECLVQQMSSCTSVTSGGRNFYCGELDGIETVFVASRIGKVAAAIAATHLIVEYHVDLILFIGVAGALDPTLSVGDIVIGNSLIQHDMDARPFCPPFVIPLLNIVSCPPDPWLQSLAVHAAQRFIDDTKSVPASLQKEFRIHQPKYLEGLILTGDQVISQEPQKRLLKERLPEALCVEMEGASIGQVCYEYHIPYLVMRIISDFADHQHTPIDVKKFVNEVAGYYAQGLIMHLYQQLHHVSTE